MKDLTISISQDVVNLGVNVLTARISGIKNTKSSPELDAFIEEELTKIKDQWKDTNYKEDSILQGFRVLHTKVGRSNRDYPASPEVLIRLLLERDRFPRINAVVDIYNLISMRSHLALGAHDIEKIQGNVCLKLTNGNESFVPLGGKGAINVPAGEYSYIDDSNNIICRMEVLQGESTKITEDSNDIFFIIQGNGTTNNQYIQQTADELVETLGKFCGGNYLFLNSL